MWGGGIDFTKLGSEDMTETDDSEYEGLIDRTNRLYLETYNYDLPERMTPKTYTPPLRKNRRRMYEVRKKNETKIEESISVTSDRGFQTDEESPKSEPTVQPMTVDDEDIPTVGDRKDNRGRRTRIGSDKDISSDTDSNLLDRLVTESATAWAGQEFSWSKWRILEKFRPPDDGSDEGIGQKLWKHYRGRLFICCQTISQEDDEGMGREECPTGRTTRWLSSTRLSM